MADTPAIKVKAFALIRRGGEVLVSLARDPVTDQTFARLLGGHVEFNETAQDALVRELHEELGATIVAKTLHGWLENMFEYAGAPGHEVIAIFEAVFVDVSLYRQEHFEMLDPHEQSLDIVWRTPDDLRAQNIPFYPAGVERFLTA